MYSNLFQILDRFSLYHYGSEEGWGFLKLSGKFDAVIIDTTNELAQVLLSLNLPMTIFVDSDSISLDELNELSVDNELVININKRIFEDNGSVNHFFYNKDSFLKWAKQINPFDLESPFNKYVNLKIVVSSLPDIICNNSLVVSKEITTDYSKRIFKLPDEKDISKIVHIISDKTITINPLKITITNCNISSELSKVFLRNSALVLTASIVNEFYSLDKIFLRGIRRVQLKLIDEKTNVSLDFIHKLAEVVSWIYEDKIETRQKLLVDRITLDINYDLPLINELVRILDSAFQQAKERYNFVIIDRKENYLKEVRDLLKDIKSQSDLYSNKIRSLLSNLLRDVLAGFLLVGFSLFTKISEITKLADSKVFLEFVFKGLSIYFLISVIVQATVDISDIIISRKELIYWRNTSREYIPVEEFNKHINESLKSRINSIWIFYPLIIILYLIIAFISWKFPIIWMKISV